MKKTLMVFVVLSIALSACVFNEPVNSNQQAVWNDGGQLGECVGPGIYTNLGAFVELVQVNLDTFAFEVSDPEVATIDNQLVSVTVSLQVRRDADSCEAIKGMLKNYPAIKDDNNAVINLLTPLIAEGMKNGVRGFKLDGLLSDRNGLSEAIRQSVQQDASKYYLNIVGVQVKNVGLAPDYVAKLQETANLTAQRELKIKEQEVLKQTALNAQFEQEQRAITLAKQLEAEKKQTDIEVEVATREGKKTAASQQVYSANPQAFELEKLRLMQKIFGDKTIYFLPQGTNLSLLLGTNNQIVPVTTP